MQPITRDGKVKLNQNTNGGRVVVSCDGGAGSSGKGCLNAWLADKYKFHLATNNWATNAGHFTEFDDGTRVLVQHIPSAFIDTSVELYINAGASLDLDVLFKEIEMIEKLGYDIRNRLTIHPNANVIIEADKLQEKELIKSGSTFKGCGAALAGKTLRQGRKLAKDYDELRPFIKDRTVEINDGVASGMCVLVEGSQGIDLDINHAEFPHVTSRQTIPTQLVADVGLPPQAVTNVIVNLRTNPIRISNQSAAKDEVCYTGNYWDAKEISWEEVAQRAGYDPEEFKKIYAYALLTSVTKKIRRVFEFPKKRMAYIHSMVGGNLPNSHVLYSLNFLNFIDSALNIQTIGDAMTPRVTKWLDENLYPIVGRHNLKWLRYGARHNQSVEI
ncbi:MAG: adenylosuccinate synthetase [Candidatus Nanopelagicaceae bacterium]|nr:adenylosuccinate synthetase [Candidatus Nanopelagicaceae bacterium]